MKSAARLAAIWKTRSGNEWAGLVGQFELRQAVLHLDEGRALEGATAEVVQELRAQGGYRGTPVPFEALEQRAGETIASGTPDPIQTRPIIDRLFPGSVAGAMGGQIISIGSGAIEWPVTTSSVTAGWQATELGNVGAATQFTTGDKSLSPKQTLGIQMRLSRKSMMQSGQALEAAIRRDMSGTMQAELDKAIFLGSGASGQPNGIIAKANSGYGITETAVNDEATWEVIKSAVVTFMTANAASGPGAVRMLCRPELWAYLDGVEAFASTGITEWARVAGALGSVTQSANAVAAPTGGTPDVTQVLLTTTAGVAPFFVGLWGAVDLIRDPYSDAASGGLRVTALATMDIAVARPTQLRVLKGLELDASGS